MLNNCMRLQYSDFKAKGARAMDALINFMRLANRRGISDFIAKEGISKDSSIVFQVLKGLDNGAGVVDSNRPKYQTDRQADRWIAMDRKRQARKEGRGAGSAGRAPHRQDTYIY